jgi:hypothetical protein
LEQPLLALVLLDQLRLVERVEENGFEFGDLVLRDAELSKNCLSGRFSFSVERHADARARNRAPEYAQNRALFDILAWICKTCLKKGCHRKSLVEKPRVRPE